jgi:putative ABC transport system substrate-binding protein
MRRRQFIGLVGAAWLGVPLRTWVHAQEAKIPIVAFLGLAPASGYTGRLDGIRTGLREFGFVEGKNFAFEFRWGETREQLRELAIQLIRLDPAVVMASGNSAALAVKREVAATAVPMVFAVADDPVRLGLVESFNKPGGNATGVSLISGALGAKRIELLQQVKPVTNLIAILVNPDNPAESNQRDEQTKALAIGQKLLVLRAATDGELEAAFARAVQEKATAILVNPDAFFTARRVKIIGLAAQHKLPAIYAWREFAEDGGLMSYGINLSEAYRQNGIYVGRILRGVKPADLPVIQPTKIELIINLTTAKSLGIEVSVKLLALADAVIE